jgi:RNA polymerase sigma-70 factor (ECF subfamily)
MPQHEIDTSPMARRSSGLRASIDHIDSQILASCQQENYDAATRLILIGYRRGVCSYLSVRARDRTCAEEAFSLFLEDVWRGLPGFRFQCKVQAWVFTVARNALCRQMKARWRWGSRHISLESQEEWLEARQIADDACVVAVRLWPLLATLPPHDRSLLGKRLALSMAWKEIALERLSAQGHADEMSLERESARLRKRYQLLVERLRGELK